MVLKELLDASTVMPANAAVLEKVPSPIVVTLAGIDMEVRELQAAKQKGPIVFKLPGSVIEDKE